MAADPTYRSDTRPDFAPFETSCGTIRGFAYAGDLASELALGGVTGSEALALLDDMLAIRELEEMIVRLRSGGYDSLPGYDYRGPTHVSIGQEAAAVGACCALRPNDNITSSHRGHGDAIAKGFAAIRHTTIPQFTVTVAVDVTRLEALRQELKAIGTRLSVTDFVLAATAQSLVELPDVNARTDGVSVWRRRRVHLGLAVSLPGGLVVPVIRDADQLGVDELHDRASALAAAARDGTLPPDDMTGGTFTVTNLGMFDVEAFSAIINPGESAILAVASALPTPVAIEGGIAIRSIMRLTLSADHRLVDGELGARFLGAVRRRLEDPGSLPLASASV